MAKLEEQSEKDAAKDDEEEKKWRCFARYVVANWKYERIEMFLIKHPAVSKKLRDYLNAAHIEKAKATLKKSGATAQARSNEQYRGPVRARNSTPTTKGR